MPILQKMGFQLPELPFILNTHGDIVGIQSKNSKVTYFTSSVPDNAITASTASDNTGIQLNYRTSRVTTVGTAGDSVVLPRAMAGRKMLVINAAASNSMDVFPTIGESINALSADTALAVAANKTVLFVCAVDGLWNALVTA